MKRGLALLAFLVLVTPACSGDDSGDRLEVTLRADSVSGRPLDDDVLDRSVAVLEDRLDQAGIDASVERDSRRVVVGFDRLGDADAVVELATRRGLLELYDLEANLVNPSIDTDGLVVAKTSRSLLLNGRREPPPNTVVLECGIGEVVCPGVTVVNPRHDFFYLIRHDPPTVPELDAGDLEFERARQDYDTTTGEAIVTMQFNREGAETFAEITRDLADRGKRLSLTVGGGQKILQHLAVVLDREIKSWPSIDWEQYPNGLSGSNGVQITGIGSLKEAKDIAIVLHSGALPVRFEVLTRP